VTVHRFEALAVEFEGHRPHLRAVAYGILGSLADADDAVQEAWLRLTRAGSDGIDNLGGWLTTVVSRVCLDMLRVRKGRRETPADERLPDPLVTEEDATDPEERVLLTDAVGFALLVVLESLAPAERLAFVLHDVFGLPFDQIAVIVGRTPATAKKLASRARHRVRGASPGPAPDLAGQRRAVDAFLSAARGGDLRALLAVLDPDVVLRTDGGTGTGGMRVLRGAAAVSGRAATFHRMATMAVARPVLVNGAAGLINTVEGAPISVMSFTVAHGRIVAIDVLSDPDRLNALDLPRA
jgi:RNA polymerase sigma-70 factor (ECF subfamily)